MKKTFKLIGLILGGLGLVSAILIFNNSKIGAFFTLAIWGPIFYFSLPNNTKNRIKAIYQKKDNSQQFRRAEKQVEKLKKNKGKIEVTGITKVDYEKLREKNPNLTVNYAHEWHKDYEKNLEKFNNIRDKIDMGEQFSLSPYQVEIFQDFSDKFLQKKINNIPPQIIKTYIAGFRYHDFRKKEVKLELEMSGYLIVDLVADPENEFDPFAVKVLLEEKYLLGYVPREHNKIVQETILAGKEAFATMDYSNYGKIDNRTTLTIELKKI